MIVGVDGHLIRHGDNAVEDVAESQVKDEDSVGSCHLEVVKVIRVVKVAMLDKRSSQDCKACQ